MFSIQQLLTQATAGFKPVSDSPVLDAEVILAFILKKTREFLLTNPNYQISSQKAGLFKKLASQRARRVPVAYITGWKEFFGRNFFVNKNVLIPRPETEGLIELVFDHIKSYKLSATSYKLLDLGTGSGCIAVTLARELRGKKIKIFASDISSQALAAAKKNARLQKVNIRFLQSDLFQNLSGKKFDIIIANLPYVRTRDHRKLAPKLKYEPRNAITDGHNNWPLYEKFLRQVSSHSAPDALIFLEIDPSSKKYITKWCVQNLKGSSVRFHKDLSGRIRYAVIMRVANKKF